VIHSRVFSGLTRKHYTKLERLARDKHSSLLRKYVNYGNKKFYSAGPRVEPLTGLHYTRAEVTGNDKHSSLLSFRVTFDVGQ
jgi:hypothetical protein